MGTAAEGLPLEVAPATKAGLPTHQPEEKELQHSNEASGVSATSWNSGQTGEDGIVIYHRCICSISRFPPGSYLLPSTASSFDDNQSALSEKSIVSYLQHNSRGRLDFINELRKSHTDSENSD